MTREIDRKAFLKRAGLGTVAAGSLPALLGTEGAFGAAPSSGQRAYEFVALSGLGRKFAHVFGEGQAATAAVVAAVLVSSLLRSVWVNVHWNGAAICS